MSSSSHVTGVAQNDLARQLLQAMPDAVLLVDIESLVILAANQLAEKLTGEPGDKLVNQSLSDIFVAPIDRSFLSCFHTSQMESADPSSAD
jgi:PAS domain-containing protein